jgi:type I restriction enzyme S subunit
MLTLKEQTMLGNVPKDWDSKPLKNLLREHCAGDWGDDGGPNMVKVLRSTNLTNDGHLDLDDIALRALPQRTVELLAPKRNDILLERSGGGPGQPVGRVGFIQADMPGHAFSNFLHLLRPNPDAINPRFLAWVLYRVNRTGRIIRLEQQTTQMRNLHFRDYLTMHLPVPPPDEQAAIARVLDAVDTALERTRAAMARARELRQGLLQASFDFRNSREPTKDTDAGRIPRSWDAIKGKQAFVIVTGGCSSVDEVRRPREGEIPDAWFMKVDDFNAPENRRLITRTKICFRAADNPDFKVLPLETVVIAKRGAAILKNRVRTTAVPVALDPNLMALQVLPGMRSDFLKYQLEWRNLSRYVESSGVPQLNNKDLYPRFFLRAPDDQQKQIVVTIAAADAHHDALVAKANAFESLKKSLMHDLLTGRVRVGRKLGGTGA